MSAAAFSIYAAGIVAVSGVTLYIVAGRGRRIDDHPICRRCGFDLFGKPAGSHRCSECGADLTLRRATRFGNRVRRRWLRLGSLAMLTPALLFLGQEGWQRGRQVRWRQFEPMWMLDRDVNSKSASRRDAALVELTIRIVEHTLSDEKVVQLTDQALAIQADLNQPWTPAWGELVEAASTSKQLSLEKWKKFCSQSVNFAVVPAGGSNFVGDTVRLNLVRGPDRAGRSRFVVKIECAKGECQVDGHTASIETQGSFNDASEATLNVPANPSAPAFSNYVLIKTRNLKAGEHDMQWPVQVRIPLETGGFFSTVAVTIFGQPDFGMSHQFAKGVLTLKPAEDSPQQPSDWVDALVCGPVGFDGFNLSFDLSWKAPPRVAYTANVYFATPGGELLLAYADVIPGETSPKRVQAYVSNDDDRRKLKGVTQIDVRAEFLYDETLRVEKSWKAVPLGDAILRPGDSGDHSDDLGTY